jgi:broad specificity phosphatase PhoE
VNSTGAGRQHQVNCVTRVLLARHGQTDWNATGRYHGQADVPLNEVGRAQVAALAEVLTDEHFDVIASSSLVRAYDTALAVAAGRGLEVLVDDRLLEVDVGEWTGWLEDAVYADDPAFAEARQSGADHQLSASGEWISQLAWRVASGIHGIAAGHRGKSILMVSHSFGLQAGLGELLGWSVQQSRRVEGLFNCALSELTLVDDQWRLVAHNICHDQIPQQRSGEVKTV